jgi:hypothetical protein
MDLLDKKRAERGEIEKRHLQTHFAEKEIQRLKDFEMAAAQDYILDLQYDTDGQIIFKKLTDWHNAKNATKANKKVIMQLIAAIWRMQEYKGTLRTAQSGATALYLETRRENQKLSKLVKEQEQQIKSQQKEIDYYDGKKA